MRKNKLPSKFFPYLALLAATGVWGIALPIMKLTLEDIPVFAFLFLRFMIVCVIVLPYLIVELKNNPISKQDVLNITVLGLLGQSSIILIFLGINLTSAIDAAIISIIAPIIIIFLGHYFYKEKISKALEIGITIATLGTAFVVFEPIFLGSTNIISGVETNSRILGNILVILYNVAFALFIILSKRIMGEDTEELRNAAKLIDLPPMKKVYSPFVHTAISFFIALVTIIPFFVLESLGLFGKVTFNFGMLTSQSIFGIVYMAIFSSLVAYFMFEWGLKRAKVSDTALFGYLGPLFTIPASFLILFEIPSVLTLLGTLIIVFGVVIAEKNKS